MRGLPFIHPIGHAAKKGPWSGLCQTTWSRGAALTMDLVIR